MKILCDMFTDHIRNVLSACAIIIMVAACGGGTIDNPKVERFENTDGKPCIYLSVPYETVSDGVYCKVDIQP